MANEATIHLSDVVTLLDETDRNGQPIPFAIVFYTYSQNTGNGGSIITLKKAVKNTGSATPAEARSRYAPATISKTAMKRRRNTNHYENYTRTIRDLTGRNLNHDLYTVHCRLIKEFNGMKVRW